MIRKYASFQILSATYANTSSPIIKDAHRAEFDYVPEPGELLVRSRAISSRINQNFDGFSAEEIRKSYKTFLGRPCFVNHNNENHRRARGVIVAVALHEDINPNGTPDCWVEVLMAIDAVHFPKLAEAIVKGEIARTSMGTDVEYSLCSFCGNKAATPAEYCKHIPRLKGKRIRRMTASGSTEDVLVAEMCYGLNFFENSLLVEEPADDTAFVLGVDTRGLSMSASKTATTEGYEEGREQGEFDQAHGFLNMYGETEDVPDTDEGNGYLDGFLGIPKKEGGQDVLSSFKLANGAYPREQVKHQTNGRSIRSEGKPLHRPSLLGSATTGFSNGNLGKIMSFGGKRVASLHKAIYNPCHVCGESATHDIAGKYKTCDNCWGLSVPKTSNRKLAYGETIAPPQVDTMRDEECPVCGSDLYDGDQCQVCQFIKPPDMFMDPDLNAAQDADFRQDQTQDLAEDVAQDLQCDSCGEAFPGQQIDSASVIADPGVNQEPTNVAANPQSPLDIPQGTIDPMADPNKSTPEQPQQVPDPTGAGVPPVTNADGKEPPSGEKLPKPGVDDDSKKPQAPDDSAGTDPNTPDPKEKKDDSSNPNPNPFAKDKQDPGVDPKDKGSDQKELVPVDKGSSDASADSDGTSNPPHAGDTPEKDPSQGKEEELKVGDPCPSCGAGTLKQINDLLAQDQKDGDDTDPTDDSTKAPDKDGGEEKDSKEEGSDDKDKPPWLKDKKASFDLAIEQSNWLVEAVVNLGDLAGLEF